jgi:hypothetical protein
VRPGQPLKGFAWNSAQRVDFLARGISSKLQSPGCALNDELYFPFWVSHGVLLDLSGYCSKLRDN